MPKHILSAFALSICFGSINCAGSYVKKIRATEEAFFSGDIDGAVSAITPLAQDSEARDRLLYYMEAGVVYHSKGDFKTSNEILLRADEMAEEIKTSITDSTKAFFLSDREGAFQGENFERVLIKYYLALNYTMMGELENAKRALRKLEADLKDMKYEDASYKQILAARYLDAIISEELKEYNDARVQYKNLENFGVDAGFLSRERYLLAAKAKDKGDLARYAAAKPAVMDFPSVRTLKDTKSESAPLTGGQSPGAPLDKNNPGELIVLVQTGKAAVKASRGNLMNDREFAVALRIAIDVAILSQGKGLSTAGVIAMMGTAENPIPKFDVRDQSASPALMVEDQSLPQPQELTNFDVIAQKNFNDNYSSYINKNVASIATKIVIAAVAAQAISSTFQKKENGVWGAIGGLAVGIGAGGAVAATVKPDLRSWHTLPTGFAVVRVLLPAGTYSFSAGNPESGVVVYGTGEGNIQILPGKKTFVSLRTFKRGI